MQCTFDDIYADGRRSELLATEVLSSATFLACLMDMPFSSNPPEPLWLVKGLGQDEKSPNQSGGRPGTAGLARRSMASMMAPPLGSRHSDSINIDFCNHVHSRYLSRPAKCDKHTRHLMRLPSFSTIVRTFYTLSNSTARALPASQRALAPFTRGTVIKSMPTIPFLSSFFGTSSSSQTMSYPVQKSDDEWQAVLNPGTFSNPFAPSSLSPFGPPPSRLIQSEHRTIPHPPSKRHGSPLRWGL